MSESGSDHFSDLEEEVSEVSSPEEREVSPPEGRRKYLVVPVISRAVPPAAKLIWTAHCAGHNLEPCRYLPLISRPK
jgi:hypothetical protein